MNIFEKLRIENRYTRGSLGRELDISVSTIYSIETGRRKAGLKIVKKYSDFFDFDIKTIIELGQNRD